MRCAWGQRRAATGAPDNPGGPARRRTWLWVALPLAVYVVLRLPILVHAPGGQDEQWFAVPGWTVWNEGVPRIPYLPTRERSTFFENADRCLMALPPALFFLQAPWHAIFPPGYATSRIPLFLGALGAIGVTFAVGRKLGASVRSSTLAATLMAISRPLMFTGLMVRPDLLAALFGWLCLLLLWKSWEPKAGTFDARWLAGSGLACGLAGLCHPFALVFAIQAGVAMLVSRPSWRKTVRNLVVFGLVCGATFALWTPLIYRFPQEFRSQFFSNVLDRAGPGLPSRLIWPWPSLWHHAELLYEFAGPWQLAFFAVGLVLATVAVVKHRDRREAIGYVALLWSSVFLTAVVAGLHPTKGYWVYPCVWILGGFALFVDRWLVRSPAVNRRPTLAFAAVAVITTALMLPGGGLRSTWLYITHWGDPKYHAPTFIAGVLEQLPEQGLFLADLSYVYDVYLSGRTTLLCQERQLYWGDRELDYTAILLAWEGDDAGWAAQYDAEFVKRFGGRGVPQMCFVDVFVQEDRVDE